MLIAELKKLQLKSELVSIERSCHDEELTGLIDAVTEQITCMNLYTNDGEYDGFTVFETSQITEVIWGNREHRAIACGLKQNNKRPTWQFGEKNFAEVLMELSQCGKSLCIYKHHDEDCFDVAETAMIIDEWIKVNGLGTRKTLSKLNKLIQVADVSRVVVDSPYQNQIMDLHAANL